jgi:hypothetical protein
MAAAAGHELGGLQAQVLVKVLKHVISSFQLQPGSQKLACAAVGFMEQLCSTSTSARRCVVDAGGCQFLGSNIHDVVRQNSLSVASQSQSMEHLASAASAALTLLAAADAKRVVNDAFPFLALALSVSPANQKESSSQVSSSALLALSLTSPIIIAAAPAMQSAKQFHSLLVPFATATQVLCPETPSSSSLSSIAHAFAILLASSPMPTSQKPSALPSPLAQYLNLLEGAGPSQFRVAAANHAALLLQPQATTKNLAPSIINSLFHTALAPYSSTLPPLQCAAVASLSSTSSIPSAQKIVSDSLSLTDVINLIPVLPASVAASVARFAGASATDANICTKLIDMRVDVLVTQACAANTKSKELREAAGAPQIVASFFRGIRALTILLQIFSSCVLALTQEAAAPSSSLTVPCPSSWLWLTLTKIPNSKSGTLFVSSESARLTQQQLRAVAAIGNLAQEKFNRYQLACGGVLEELKAMLLDEAKSDAFKAQCLRVAALIISTNHPTGKLQPPNHLLNCLTPSSGDNFAGKFLSKNTL